jgi:hypothetical protein
MIVTEPAIAFTETFSTKSAEIRRRDPQNSAALWPEYTFVERGNWFAPCIIRMIRRDKQTFQFEASPAPAKL